MKWGWILLGAFLAEVVLFALAAAFYVAYVVSHFLKIIGGALGGWMASRVGSRTPSESTS